MVDYAVLSFNLSFAINLQLTGGFEFGSLEAELFCIVSIGFGYQLAGQLAYLLLSRISVCSFPPLDTQHDLLKGGPGTLSENEDGNGTKEKETVRKIAPPFETY